MGRLTGWQAFITRYAYLISVVCSLHPGWLPKSLSLSVVWHPRWTMFADAVSHVTSQTSQASAALSKYEVGS